MYFICTHYSLCHSYELLCKDDCRTLHLLPCCIGDERSSNFLPQQMDKMASYWRIEERQNSMCPQSPSASEWKEGSWSIHELWNPVMPESEGLVWLFFTVCFFFFFFHFSHNISHSISICSLIQLDLNLGQFITF